MEATGAVMTVHRAENLKNVKHVWGKMNPYVITAGDGFEQRTNTAKSGGSNPSWEQSMPFYGIDDDTKKFNFKIYHEGRFHDRPIGHGEVHVKDFLERGASGEEVSYPVMPSSGEQKGELILSYKYSMEGGQAGGEVLEAPIQAHGNEEIVKNAVHGSTIVKNIMSIVETVSDLAGTGSST